MRQILKAILTSAWIFPAGAAVAQDAWLQLEAKPNLTEARQAASDYARSLQDVAGFQLGNSGWYAIAIGPLGQGEATSLRSRLLSSGAIPGDAFVSDGQRYGQRFWPIGASPDEEASVSTEQGTSEASPETAALTEPEPDPEPGQTLAEARAAESRLSRDERVEVQRQLRRLGHYRGGLDGAFGPGTRSAMSSWQSARGDPTTGVLTSDQRRDLAEDYEAIVEAEGPMPETPAEARQSEALLSGAERAAIQEALQWAGVYDGPIDGDFGRGTRNAMAAWQQERGRDVTGILTTRQREELLSDYNAVLEGLGLAEVVDDVAGIAIIMPTALVEFAGHDAPFARYDAADETAAYRVLLISQRGDVDTLHGLFDIMQTLEIVPPSGPREKTSDSFTLTGRDSRIVSHTQAWLDDGAIKGFTLVWPTGDEERRTRLLAEMRQSFRTLDGVVMPDTIGPGGREQRIDLVSGLQVRQPDRARSGFFVDDRGSVLTTTEALEGCSRITLDDSIEATVAAMDTAAGLALLIPGRALAPLSHARLTSDIPRLNSDVAVAGFSFGGVLGAPSLTYGTVADIRGLNGDESLDRLNLSPQPGDAGGPVLDSSGEVLGMLLPQGSVGNRTLPDGVSFAADASAISAFLEENGISASDATPVSLQGPLTNDELARKAAGMTALVSCWK